MNKNQWWGYKHDNGSVQAKRYFSRLDITEAQESAFIETVTGPFEAADRDEALKIVAERTGGKL